MYDIRTVIPFFIQVSTFSTFRLPQLCSLYCTFNIQRGHYISNMLVNSSTMRMISLGYDRGDKLVVMCTVSHTERSRT